MGSKFKNTLKIGLMGALALVMAACSDPAPTSKKVASYPPVDGIVTINIYQKLDGTYTRNGNSYLLDAYGTALSGYVWRQKGALVTRADALRSAKLYCKALGTTIASGYYAYGGEDSRYAGVYFNCR